MSQYRKKPVTVDAVQIEIIGEHADMPPFNEYPDWLDQAVKSQKIAWDKYSVVIQTDSGIVTAQPGDYLIRGTAGELYPCKAEVFATIYEPVGE